MISRTDSGSRRSTIAVDPLTSEKTKVTVFRWVPSPALSPAGLTSAKAPPHRAQSEPGLLRSWFHRARRRARESLCHGHASSSPETNKRPERFYTREDPRPPARLEAVTDDWEVAMDEEKRQEEAEGDEVEEQSRRFRRDDVYGAQG